MLRLRCRARSVDSLHERTNSPQSRALSQLEQVKQRRAEDAKVVLEQALLRERRPEALVAIGAMHLLSGREHEAQARFREALVIDPQNPEAHINLALIDMLNGDYDKTIKRLRQMLERHASPQAQKLLAETQRRQREN